MTSHLERLGRNLARLEEDLKRLTRSNNLGHSAIEGGAIQQYTGDGTLGSIIGEQYDGSNGTVVVSGPRPPQPNAPVAYSAIGGIGVRYDGTFADGPTVVAPLDFSSFEIHVSDTPNFSALLFDTLKTNIASARGGEVFIPLAAGTYYVRIVTRTLSGGTSIPSAPAGPVEATKILEADLGFNIGDLGGGNTISRGPDAPDSPIYGDLWLQTPDNVAYQWTPNPDAWVKVQDQNIVKAINDAADAAGLANAAGLTASDAKSLAQSAQGVADQANTAAQAASDAAALAQSTAAKKVTVYRQTTAPVGGSYVVNDLWMDTDANNQLFAWSGGAWVASDDQRIATALTNASSAQTVAGAKTTLFAQTSAPATTGRVTGDTWIDTDDSNKVYVWSGSAWTVTLFGAAALGATARQLGAITIFRQTSAPVTGMVTGDYWLDSDDGNKAYYYSAGWVVVQDTGITTALNNAATAQATADGKARIFYQTSAPTGMVAGDVGDEWVDTDDSYVTYTWSGTAWVKNALSTSSFQPNSVVASTILATGSVTAALLEAVMVLATVIIAGNPTGRRAVMSKDGFQTIAVDPGTGAEYVATQQGGGVTTNDRYAVAGPDGSVRWSVDDTGSEIVQNLSVANEPVFQGRKLTDYLKDLPQGIVASSYFQSLQIDNIYTRYGIAETSFISRAGRNYEATWHCPHIYCSSAGTRAMLTMRVTTDGSAPTINSPVIDSAFFNVPAGGGVTYTPPDLLAHGVFSATDGALVRILVCVESFSGGGTLGITTFSSGDPYFRPLRLQVKDIGRDIPDTYIANPGGGQLSGGSPPPPPPAARTTQTVIWGATWAQSYKGTGAPRSDTNDAYQGNGDSFNGRNSSLIGFDTASIRSYLSGATINSVEAYLYAEHWWNYSGGTGVIGVHGWDNPAPNGNTSGASWGAVGSYHFGRGEGAWFTLPSGLWAGWANGSIRGLSLSAPNDSTEYYGRFSGAADSTKPIIRITFTK